LTLLTEYGAMEYTTVVAATASDSAPLQFLAPSRAPRWASTSGTTASMPHHYDDLSKHAVAYRQLSLLLRRPPGRGRTPGTSSISTHAFSKRSAKWDDAMAAGPYSPPDHRDPGGRRFRVYSDKRHLHHRRSDLPGAGIVLRRCQARDQRRYLGIEGRGNAQIKARSRWQGG
jgi:hypothetical protein